LAKKNAERNAVSDQITFAQGDLFEAKTLDRISLREAIKQQTFDLICCNPPYIPSEEIDSLMPEVRGHEPRLALDGGADGLDFYRRLAQDLASPRERGGRCLPTAGGRGRLAPILLLEIGCEQGKTVGEIFESAGAARVTIHRDLAGLDRVAEIEWSITNV
ncbi:MAG: hypothetical protein J5496_02350, partial [Lachnospiraceae bacterium]|nr:hypothetical protein [Lachnospiraceae bacterium]